MKKISFRESIEKRRIIPFGDGPKLVHKEYATAKEDLREAQKTFSLKSYKWATIQAYYAIYHTSRALLYAKKYREKSHTHLGIAIQALYIATKELSIEYYDTFIQAMTLRELADYKRKYSEESAEKIIASVEKAIKEAGQIIKKIHKK
jgi:hypothetical protein